MQDRDATMVNAKRITTRLDGCNVNGSMRNRYGPIRDRISDGAIHHSDEKNQEM